jgi:hypothetical protein
MSRSGFRHMRRPARLWQSAGCGGGCPERAVAVGVEFGEFVVDVDGVRAVEVHVRVVGGPDVDEQFVVDLASNSAQSVHRAAVVFRGWATPASLLPGSSSAAGSYSRSSENPRGSAPSMALSLAPPRPRLRASDRAFRSHGQVGDDRTHGSRPRTTTRTTAPPRRCAQTPSGALAALLLLTWSRSGRDWRRRARSAGRRFARRRVAEVQVGEILRNGV